MNYRSDGEEFLASLRRLGLDPEGAFWAEDDELKQTVLVIITSALDEVGPYALSEVFVKAYNASALPKSISPFIIRFHSPKHRFVQILAENKTQELKLPVGDLVGGGRIMMKVAGSIYNIDLKLLYHFRVKSRNAAVDARRRWNRFERNVSALAA